MTTYGPTPDGYRRKTFAEIKGDIGAEWHTNISKKLDLESATSPTANLLNPVCDAIALVHEGLEYEHNSRDVNNATAESAITAAALVGLSPLPASAGHVTATVNLNEGIVYAAGALIAYVENEPSNLWANLDAIDTTAASIPANYQTRYESLTVGASAKAPTGTLIRRSANITGWNSITNATDAEAGKDIETPEELMFRRQGELARTGAGTKQAIRSDVLAVDGVQQCEVFSNRTSEAVDGIPAHSHRVVIWDGDAEDADNDAVAQAIFESQADGSRSFGTEYGTAVDPNGTEEFEFFDRAITRETYAIIEVESAAGVNELAVKEALANFVTGLMGGRVVVSRMAAEALKVDGVDDVLSLKFDLVDPAVNTGNLQAAADERFNLDTANVDVIVTEPE